MDNVLWNKLVIRLNTWLSAMGKLNNKLNNVVYIDKNTRTIKLVHVDLPFITYSLHDLLFIFTPMLNWVFIWSIGHQDGAWFSITILAALVLDYNSRKCVCMFVEELGRVNLTSCTQPQRVWWLIISIDTNKRLSNHLFAWSNAIVLEEGRCANKLDRRMSSV